MVTGDRGAAAVWSLALTVALVSVALVIAMIGGVAVSRARAATVADLAAVAGARDASCDHARAVVESNGMRLAQCSMDQGDVVVRVMVAPPATAQRVASALGADLGDIEAQARAGYVLADSPG